MKSILQRKSDERGITHQLLLAGLAVVVVGAIGFASWRIINKSPEAQAVTWTDISTISEGGRGGGNPPKVSFRGCKLQPTTSTYKVKVRATKAADGIKPTIALGKYTVAAGFGPTLSSSSTWVNDKTLLLTITVSKTLKDKVWYSNQGPDGGIQSMFDPAKLINCP